MTCAGDNTAYCGAGNRLSVYIKNGTSSAGISSSSSSGSSRQSLVISSSTGVSSSTQGSSSSSLISSSTTNLLSSSRTSSTSSAATPSQTLAISKTVGKYTFQGCYTEASSNRALMGASFYNYTAMTLELCASSCSGYTWWGVEYGGECTFLSPFVTSQANFEPGYCGNTLDSTSLNTTMTDCSFSCPGNQYEYCGARNRVQMYKLSPVSSSASSSVSSSSSTLPTNNAVVASTSSSTSSSVSPTQTTTSSSSTVSASTSRSTTTTSSSSVLPTSTSSTLQSSSSTLRSTTSSTSPTSSTSQSSTLQSSSSTLRTTTSSPSPTSSSSSSSFSSSSSSTTSSKAATYTGPPVTSEGNANFTYYSCISEPASGRALSKQVENNGTYMTIEKCLSDCWMYQYAGVEYGRECWCGNTLNTGGANLNLTDDNCSSKCPGNSSEFCGAGKKLNLYWFDVKKAMMNNGTLQG